MIVELEQALHQWYHGSGSLRQRTAGMWPGAAPPPDASGRPLPYITYDFPGLTPDDTMSGRGEDLLIAVRIRSAHESPREAGEIYALFRARFDRAEIPVSGWATVRLVRVGGGGRIRDPDGGWMIAVTYEWTVDQN